MLNQASSTHHPDSETGAEPQPPVSTRLQPHTKFTSAVLNSADRNEPIFVLRAQDKLAATVVRDWCDRAHNAGVNREKIMEARAIADLMDAWPNRKKPD